MLEEVGWMIFILFLVVVVLDQEVVNQDSLQTDHPQSNHKMNVAMVGTCTWSSTTTTRNMRQIGWPPPSNTCLVSANGQNLLNTHCLGHLRPSSDLALTLQLMIFLILVLTSAIFLQF